MTKDLSDKRIFPPATIIVEHKPDTYPVLSLRKQCDNSHTSENHLANNLSESPLMLQTLAAALDSDFVRH